MKLTLWLCVFLAMPASTSMAQRIDAPSKETIVDALKPKKYRGMRGVNVTPGGGLVASPSIDLKVNFGYNSAELTTDAQLVLQNLGQALTDPTLKDYRFRVIGHTDAVGGDAFNQRLSEARARSVADHLVAKYAVAPDRLLAEGQGKSRLIDPTRPTAESNRRVEIINIGQ